MFLKIMTENQAKEISEWEYEERYLEYNYGGWEKCINENQGIANKEIRNLEFFNLLDNANQLVGFIRITNAKNLVILGIGIKPELCNKGLGKIAINLAVQKAKVLYQTQNIILMVKENNYRAIKCYEKSGFVVINKNFVLKDDKFWIMKYINK